MPSEASPPDRSRQAIQDMLDNARLAMDFAAGREADDVQADLRTLYAVIRCLEIISEASRRVAPAVQARHPALPWRAIAAAGNVYRHEYDNLTPDLVWNTVRRSLPAVIAFGEAELGRQARPSPSAP
jgi:uncharacterized protein with HEPN domain